MIWKLLLLILMIIWTVLCTCWRVHQLLMHLHLLSSHVVHVEVIPSSITLKDLTILLHHQVIILHFRSPPLILIVKPLLLLLFILDLHLLNSLHGIVPSIICWMWMRIQLWYISESDSIFWIKWSIEYKFRCLNHHLTSRIQLLVSLLDLLSKFLYHLPFDLRYFWQGIFC